METRSHDDSFDCHAVRILCSGPGHSIPPISNDITNALVSGSARARARARANDGGRSTTG